MPSLTSTFTPLPTLIPTRTDTPALAPSLIPTSTITPTSLPTPTSTLTPLRVSDVSWGKIVFTCQVFRDSTRNQICLVNADGTGYTRLTQEDTVEHTYPSFSPDGLFIVFAAKKGDNHQIYEMDLPGNQRRLTDLPFDAYAPDISPDNRRIVFTTNDGRHQTLWMMNRDGSDPRPLTFGDDGDAWDAVWSPDGQQILFASDRAGSVQLFIMNADGSTVRQVTYMDDLRGRSDWSPNGLTIATYAGKPWEREIYLMGVDGINPRQITHGGNNLAPSFSPDGNWIAFTSYLDNYKDDHGCEIYIMRVDGSQITRLTDNGYCDWQPRWGP